MFTLDQWMETLRQIVVDFGEDYKIGDGLCFYEDKDGNRCLIGEAIWRLDAQKLEEIKERGDNGTSCYEVLPFFGLADQNTAAILYAGQQMQDKGSTWGHALKEIERVRKIS